ncbi:MAG: phosphotransferase [Candidatus Cloacimonetes bacterium]|nr:phosphotransferase [Candidatus Cloacimonadota bacterium]
MQSDLAFLRDISDFWGIPCCVLRKDLAVAGSPERVQIRLVLQDEKDRLFLLEGFRKNLSAAKLRIVNILNYLIAKEIPWINPYLPGENGQFFYTGTEYDWQISAYLAGVALPRPDYLHDGWRGETTARFALLLLQPEILPPELANSEPFSLIRFILDLIEKIKINEPLLYKRLQPVTDYLQSEFFIQHDLLPIKFTHGDLHPLNIIWSANSMQAVIDWEFTGLKPFPYDAANLIGCLGMEAPQGLLGNFCRAFLAAFRQGENFLTPGILFDFVLALRFAWLSEWLRSRDEMMIKLEVDYIGLLKNNKDLLIKTWDSV